MQTKVLEITVEGEVGTGKSHVLASIEQGLKAAYGPTVQVVSRDLAEERNLVGSALEMNRPNLNNTVFVLRETNGSEFKGDPRTYPDEAPRLRPFRGEPEQTKAPIRNWQDGFLHVVGSTYLCLSEQSVLSALTHAEKTLDFGTWTNKDKVLMEDAPREFPTLISFRWNMHTHVTLTKIEQLSYCQFFANLTGQPCSGFEPVAPIQGSGGSTQLC